MNMIRTIGNEHTTNKAWSDVPAPKNGPCTLVEMGLDLAAARSLKHRRWLNVAIGDFLNEQYATPYVPGGALRIVADGSGRRWHDRADRILSSHGIPAVFHNYCYGGSPDRVAPVALVVGRLPTDIWSTSTSQYVQNADAFAVRTLFRDDAFAFARPEFLRHYGVARLIALAPKYEAAIRLFAVQNADLLASTTENERQNWAARADHCLRIDGALVPVRCRNWHGEFGQSRGSIFTCVRTGKVWHQPIGGELQGGLPPVHTQPIATSGQCSEDAARHREICKAVRAASKMDGYGGIALHATDNGAAYAGQGIRGKSGTVVIDEAASFPSTAEEWAEIDAADGVEYDLEPIPSPYFYTDGQLCRRATWSMLASLWACLASLFRRVI